MNKKLLIALILLLTVSMFMVACGNGEDEPAPDEQTGDNGNDEAEEPGEFDDYPNRPVRVIVAYGPGGGNDLTSRVLMQEVGDILGQPFNVENIVGASGTVGATVASKALPDGYNIFFTVTDTMAVQQALIETEYDFDDFRGIAGFSYEPQSLQ